MKKIITLISAALLLSTVSTGSVFAFTDLDATEKEPIMMLKEKGIVDGVDSTHFAPRRPISYAQSVSLLVKGLNLNLDTMRFIKKPEASDYFTNVPNDAWYAEAFIIAHLNGLNIPKNVDPSATITREQYADLLIHAMDKKGTFPVILMYIGFADEDQIDKAYINSMQLLYLHKIAKTEEKRMAYPKREMTRGEAAVWVSHTIQFLKAHSVNLTNPQQDEVTVAVDSINADLNKITLSRGITPNPGYGIKIEGIRFQTDGTAQIQYSLTEPQPGMMYPQVVTESKAETFLSSKYKPIAVNVTGAAAESSVSSSPNPSIIVPTEQ
ncbi:S-layer homology domain-containing protein [Paenibacillus sp. 1_12]|uniref:S-layer homology domain-containing protein n=1 Tax=Paenibacillus sp. 1_12 TaxID=1566278 RepID=UPI0008E69F9F|nr:S-layer homology domain-containing protein [Paenibacillus sp. 1_12]SFK96770.1 S-layer homology domain-containing protein [Paenibacillus sp. 1_12]